MLATLVPAAVASSPAPVNLGTAGNFVILAKTEISTTGVTAITGDIGISPAAASFITGFALILPSGSAFSTSALVTGKVYAPGYADPTPANLTTAVLNMQTAYTDAAGRTLPDYTELYAGDVTGKTLTHGLYKWGTGVQISAGGVTFSGSVTDVWIFQIAQNLTVANAAIVTLSGGAQASNIFWQIAGQVTIGTTAQMKGIILCQTQIAMNTGASLEGRALAQTAVTLIANTITQSTTVVITSPTVTSTDPVNAVTGVGLSKQIIATFSTGMDASTITTSTFTLMQGTTSVSGGVLSSGTTATFAPASNLLPNALYTATITTGAKDLAGNALANNYVWSFTTAVGTTVENGITPQGSTLSQNYPNPFNPSTKIEYSLEKADQVSLKIYNVLGNEVATLVNGRQEVGSYTVLFGINNGTFSLSSGVYFYRLETGSFVSTKKLILVK